MENDNSLFDTLMAATTEPVIVTDSDCRVVHVSRMFEAATGLARSALLGQGIERLADAALGELLRDAIASGGMRKRSIDLSGNATTWELVVEPILEGGTVTGCISFLRPPAGGLEQREGFDELTGLPNRHLFVDRLEQAMNNARRGNKLAMVMLTGIDRFREINDVVGEQAGSRILRDIAARLQHCVRNSDTVARLDGDRFAFVMQIAAIDDSVLLTEKVLHAFEQPFSLGERNDVVVGCSVGVSLYPADGKAPDELIRNAAAALHHARQGGGSRCQFFSGEMNERARQRLQMESNIRRALGNREFVVYYQPKIDINSQRVAGMEALIRWRDPERGMVSPGEFIPVAEESGLIEQIGQWVLEETCAQNRRWQDEGLPPVCASVNVSARQFRNRNFVFSVAEILGRTGLDPRWLELEITESILMGDINAIVARMEELRRLGVSLSIDDFGTGYSSLSYLSRFPVTTLKIDRAFIADVQSNPNTAEIARAIIGLSRGLNLEVVAEGAEVQEQVDFLRVHGCDVVQGYFYSKPLPADEFAAMLRLGSKAG